MACKSDKDKNDETYVALAGKTNVEYFTSPERAYSAEIKFAEYVKDSIRRGIPFPDKKILVWVYPRIALAAEYSGRKEEASRIFAFAEQYAKRVSPDGIYSLGKFSTFREATIYMDRESKVPWLK